MLRRRSKYKILFFLRSDRVIQSFVNDRILLLLLIFFYG